MSPEVQRRHIDLYVNDFTRDLGEEGYEAIETLLGRAHREGLYAARTDLDSALTRAACYDRYQASIWSANARSSPATVFASERSG